MKNAPKHAPPKKKQPAAVLTSEMLREQTEAFLKAGGKIEKVRSGVSGQTNFSGPRQISLGNK